MQQGTLCHTQTHKFAHTHIHTIWDVFLNWNPQGVKQATRLCSVNMQVNNDGTF